MKEEGVLRIWYANSNRFSPDKVEKIIHFKRACKTNQIQYYLFSATDRRWNTTLKE